METLKSYIAGEHVAGTGKKQVLVNPTTEEPIAETSTEGIDFEKALAFARNEGGPKLRAMSFAERGEMIRAISRAIHAERDALLGAAIQNGGNTRSDAKFDIDGATGTLAYYADLGKELGDQRFLLDGDALQLGRTPRFAGQHVIVPRQGAAVHVNAFNFPAWGLAEKAACALLAGMPIVTKPATSTALVAARIMAILAGVAAVPRGAIQFVCGSPGDLLSHLGPQDVLAFTGSSDTGATLRATPSVLRNNVRVNIEADSLNSAILGPDVAIGSDTFSLFLRDVARDMTQKAGQKCTAIRRIFVPADKLDEVVEALAERLADVKTGDPANDAVTVGPLATAQQLRDVRAGIDKLAAESTLVRGGNGPFEKVGVPGDKGYFVPPTLFVQRDASAAKAVHEHEVFGPVATILPYSGSAEDVGREVAKGQGSLVSSAYTDDRAFSLAVLMALAAYNGRVMLGSEKLLDQTPGPGTVLPSMIHGGPGRAGSGEELGGLRGLMFYSQRVAVQGARPILDAILGGKKG